MPLIVCKCKLNRPTSQREGRMPKQTPALKIRQRVQFLVARNVQQDRSEFRRWLFAEDAFEAVFGVPPQTPGFAQHQPAFSRQLDVTLAPIVCRQLQHHQIVPLQRLEVVPQGGPIHDHRRCEFAHGDRALAAASVHFGENGVLSRFDADESQRSIVELRNPARRLAQAAASACIARNAQIAWHGFIAALQGHMPLLYAGTANSGNFPLRFRPLAAVISERRRYSERRCLPTLPRGVWPGPHPPARDYPWRSSNPTKILR